MKIKCDSKIFNDVVEMAEVPSIYFYKGERKHLPPRMSKLRKEAAESLIKAEKEIVESGGTLYLSDMFRTAKMQHDAHMDYVNGKKAAYSPPAGGSMHEAASAIDIDTGSTGIGHKKVREILNKHGWTQLNQHGVPGKNAALSGKECWHYEYRSSYQEVYLKKGYKTMVKTILNDIGNVYISDKLLKRDPKLLQLLLEMNGLYSGSIDGVVGHLTHKAILSFQHNNALVADGIVGNKTWRKLGMSVSGMIGKENGANKNVLLLLEKMGFPSEIDRGLKMLAKQYKTNETVKSGLRCLKKMLINL